MAASRHGRAMAMVRWRDAPLCSGIGKRERGARAKWGEQQRHMPFLPAMQRAWPTLGRPLTARRPRPSGPKSVTDSASFATSIS